MDERDKKAMIDIIERLTTVETKLEMIIDNTKVIPSIVEQIKKLQQDYSNNNEEHKCFRDTFVSSKVFFAWLSALAIILGIITTILFLFRR